MTESETQPTPKRWGRVITTLLLVLPVLFASAYMWAMWDPKAYIKNIPVAVVTEDVGVGEGEDFSNYGDAIAQGILDLDYLNFTRMEAEEAQAKLGRGELMMVMNIPEDFSRKAATIIDDNPVRPTITFDLNDFYGTQSAFITGSLIPELQASVAQAVTAEYATSVIDGLKEMSSGLAEASDGAKQLDDGAGQLQEGGAQAVDGIGQLKDGTTQLRDGAGQLADGTGELKDGTMQLRDGAGQLAAGMDELRDGTTHLADGAGQIKDGVKELTDMLIPLLSEAQGAVGTLAPAVGALRAAGMQDAANELAGLLKDLDPANSENLVAQLGLLRDGTAELHYNLADPSAPYLSGVLQLQDGARQLRDGAGELDNGASQLQDGAGQLADGTVQLDDGMTELSDGAAQLKDGMDQLKDGTGQLSTGLADGVSQAPAINAPVVSAQNMSTPIEFVHQNLNPVQTAVSAEDPTAVKLTGGASILVVTLFGFMLVALLALLLPSVIRRHSTGVQDSSAVRSNLLAFGLQAGASVVVKAVVAAVSASLGWEPASWGAAVAVLLLAGVAGAALFHVLRTAFGPVVGAALVVVAYVAGLFASGAIWPEHATPGWLRLFHVVHPMGHTRDAFVRASAGIFDGLFTQGMLGLIVITVLCVALSAVLAKRRS